MGRSNDYIALLNRLGGLVCLGGGGIVYCLGLGNQGHRAVGVSARPSRADVVVVESVRPGSAADEGGVRYGDVILEMDREILLMQIGREDEPLMIKTDFEVRNPKIFRLNQNINPSL